MISTSAIPTNGGVGENESYAIVGDFAEGLVLAFPRMYRLIADPFGKWAENTLRVMLLVHFGVVISDPKAFEILSAVTE